MAFVLLTDGVQHEADETMVLGEGNEVGVNKHNVLEVVDDRLAIQEVVGNNEEVPSGQSLATPTCNSPVESLVPGVT
jgi:hypothetical protein